MNATLQTLLEALDAQPSGDGWIGHCPAHEDTTSSLSINEKDGKILVHCHAGCQQSDVIATLKDRGLWPTGGGNGQGFVGASNVKTKVKPQIPIPEDAKHALNKQLRSAWTLRHRGEAIKSWRYHMPDGAWAFGIVRFEKDDRKSVIPYYLGIDGQWYEGQPFKYDRPLYQLPRILANPTAPVLICEGEKPAEAGQNILGDEFVVTSWAGGASSVTKTDWSPLADRVVTIWPDRDDPGRKAALAISKRLPRARFIDPGLGFDGWDVADAVAEGWDRERILAFIATATLPEEEPSDERIELQITKGNTPQLADQVMEILDDRGGLYQFGEGQTILVRIADCRTEILTVPWLLGHLERLIRFVKYDARSKDLVPTDATERLVKLILDGRGDLWSSFPHVRGIVRTPVLRLDGSILDNPGYDSETGLLYLPMAACPDVPTAPTMDQIRDAITKLWTPFRLFPYDSDESRTIALAAMLTTQMRSVFRTAPGFGFDAPMFGTGKTLLARSIAAIATGSYEPPVAWPTSEEEAAKLLLATFIAAPSVRLFDNVDGVIRSPSLYMVLTAEKMSGRILGLSKHIDVPTRTLIMLSGNNLTLMGDLPRRVLVCRLDAGIEAPYTREFDFDPLEIATREWQDLAVAVLTILRGFFVAGAPHYGSGTVGSFEEWARIIRQTLLWIQDNKLAPFVPTDLLGSISDAYSADPDTVRLSNLLSTWRSMFGAEPASVRHVVETAIFWEKRDAPDFDPELDARRQALLDAINEIARDRGGINNQRLGTWLSKHADRPVNGFRFVASTVRDGHARWYVLDNEEAAKVNRKEDGDELPF